LKSQPEHDATMLDHQGLVHAIAWKIHRQLAGEAARKDISANGTSASFGRAERMMRSNRRS